MTTWEWVGIGALVLLLIGVYSWFTRNKPSKVDESEHSQFAWGYAKTVLEIQNDITSLLPDEWDDEQQVLDPQKQAKTISKLDRMYKNWHLIQPPQHRQYLHSLLARLIHSTMREMQSGLTDQKAQQESEELISALRHELARLNTR